MIRQSHLVPLFIIVCAPLNLFCADTTENTKKNALEFFSTHGPIVIDKVRFEEAMRDLTLNILPSQQSNQPQTILVINSSRQKESNFPYFAKSLWHEGLLDLSYGDKPNIVTMHTEASVNPGTHIQADIITCKLPLKNIKTTYLQAPCTVDTTGREPLANVIHQGIQNISLHFRNCNEFILEWYPTIRTVDYSGESITQDTQESRDLAVTILQNQNPFSGIFELKKMLVATSLAINLKLSGDEMQPLIAEARKIVPNINSLLNFYATKQQATRDDLNTRLKFEVTILNNFAKYHQLKNAQTIILPEDLEGPIIKFNNNTDYMLFSPHPYETMSAEKMHDGTLGRIFLTQKGEREKPFSKKNYYYSQEMFIAKSLFGFLLSDIAVGNNKELVIACFQKLGLKDVTLDRSTSPVNGRKNVWLLGGFKQ